MNDAAGGHPREQLSSYMDDELGVDERMAIDRHLAVCEDCRVQLEAMRRIARALADESVPETPIDLAAKIGRRLDGGASVRPRRIRFAVPVSIAATLGAIGLLVALQWREGRLGAPVPPPPPAETPALDSLKSEKAQANDRAPAKDKAPEPRPADRQDLKKSVPTPTIEPEQKQVAAGGASREIVGGASDGVEGGASGRVANSVTQAAPMAPAPVEAARERDFKRDERSALNEPVPAVPEAAAAKAVVRPLCAEHWSDSGARGTWVVPDVDSAAQALDRIARDVSGIGIWHGAADGRPYTLVVPRRRFEEVYYALRARGVSGLDELPALPEGNGCAGISVGLTLPAPP